MEERNIEFESTNLYSIGPKARKDYRSSAVGQKYLIIKLSHGEVAF